MSYEVKIWNLNDKEIPEVVREKELLEDPNEDAWEQNNILCVFHDGEFVKAYYDGGSPEDNTFGRDWLWVKGALEAAYRFGREDGV